MGQTPLIIANKGSSTVKRLQQRFDNDTQEHVIWFDYRIRARDAQSPKPDPNVLEQKQAQRMKHLIELAARMNENAAQKPSSQSGLPAALDGVQRLMPSLRVLGFD